MTGLQNEQFAADWQVATESMAAAIRAVVQAPPGIARQSAYDRLLESERHCTDVVHSWLANAVHLERVSDPCMILSLDVDGVLENEVAGFSCTSLAGIAALRLLQLGRVAVLLNTGRSVQAVRDRSTQFRLFGGVAEFGAVIWDGVFGREESALPDERGLGQLARLRSVLWADNEIVLDPTHRHSVRVSQLSESGPEALPGSRSRHLLDRHELSELSFWVAPRHTDFVPRRGDKATGLARLREELGLASLPLAAMGDAACDVPMLKAARSAFLPAGTLPSYLPPPRQKLMRSRWLADGALWDAACHLVPSPSLQQQVLETIAELVFPTWFPLSLRRRPPGRFRWVPLFIGTTLIRRNS